MPGMTDYSATNWLNYITGKAAIPATPTAFVGLFTTAPTSDSGVTGAVEVSGGSYARVSTAASTWNSASNSSGSEPSVTPANITNAQAITFATATADWGTIVAYGLFDAVSAGNCLTWDYVGSFSWFPFSCTNASPGVITMPAHGFSNGDKVVVTSKFGGTLPTTGGSWSGLLTVANVTTDTFTVGVNTTSTGEGLVRKVASVAVNNNSQASFAIGALKLTAG